MEKTEYEARWPNYCRHCQGWGAFTSSFDPSPAGVSLGAGKMLEVDPCPECTDLGRCARCGGIIDPASDQPCPTCGWCPPHGVGSPWGRAEDERLARSSQPGEEPRPLPPSRGGNLG